MSSSTLPDSITGADEEFISRLISALKDDERVATLFLGGSRAQGKADQFPDLDLYLITTDEGYESLVETVRELLKSLGQAVFLEEYSPFGFLMLFFRYADGVSGELAIAPMNNRNIVQPKRVSREFGAGPRVTLLDKRGGVEGKVFSAVSLDDAKRAEIERQSVRGLLVWFWLFRGHLEKVLGRGRLLDAKSYLAQCRDR